jgi:WD40 repeat protein
MPENYYNIRLRIRKWDAEARAYPVEADLSAPDRHDDGHFTGLLNIDRETLLQYAVSPVRYGMALQQALFAERIDDAYEKATGRAESQTGGRLRVRLWLDIPDDLTLHALPWERLYHLYEGAPLPLAATERTPFSRYLGLELTEAHAVTGQAHMLVSIANPTNLPAGTAPVDVAAELTQLCAAIGKVGQNPRLRISLMPGRTGVHPDLQARLEASGYAFVQGPVTLNNVLREIAGCDIWQHIGHGSFSAEDQEAVLHLERDDGTWQPVPDRLIATRMKAAHLAPHLVTLVACESAKVSEQGKDPLTGLAPKLAAAGVPAVIAMQDVARIDPTRRLIADFYRRLLQHGLVDVALNEARALMIDPDGGSGDWAVPVLFMHLEDGRLFSPADEPAQAPAPFEIEAPPPDFVPRPDELNPLVQAMLAARQSSAPTAKVVALVGASGSGKTTLVRAACYDVRIREAYPDGVVCVALGDTPGDLTAHVNSLLKSLTGQQSGFARLDLAQESLAAQLGERALIMVINDVADPAHLAPFLQGGMRCLRLVTTRDKAALPPGIEPLNLSAMTGDEALQLLSAGLPPGYDTALRNLAQRLGAWPLALRLANNTLRDLVEQQRLDLDAAVARIAQSLDQRGLATAPAGAQEQQVVLGNLLRVVLDLLPAAEAERYHELAIFPPEEDIPLAAIQRLWRARAGTTSSDAESLATRLSALSLLGFDRIARTFRIDRALHTQFAPEVMARLAEWHGQFLDADRPRRWAYLSRSETYLWRHLVYHLAGAGRNDELERLLLDFNWMQGKLDLIDVIGLITDYDFAAPDSPARQVQAALRLAAHILAQDEMQLATQMLGRLQALAGPVPALQGLIDKTRQWGAVPWLRPLSASLSAPGGPLVHALPGHSRAVYGVAHVHVARQVVSASLDRTLKLWDIDSGMLLRTFTSHGSWVNAVAVTPDGRSAISAGADNTLIMWDLAGGEYTRILTGHDGPVTAVAITPDGRRVVSGSLDRTICVWNIADGALLFTLAGHANAVTAVAVAPDGRWAASASWDHTVRIWDLQHGTRHRTLYGHAGAVFALAFTPDGAQILSGGDDRELKLWDWQSGMQRTGMTGHTARVHALAITADGQRAVSAGWDHTLRLWDMRTGAETRTLATGITWIHALAVMPGSREVVSADWDNALRVWQLDDRRLVEPTPAHKRNVIAIAVTRDGARAVSASWDYTLRIWDTASGAGLRELTGHRASLSAVALVPETTWAASADEDGSIHLWDLETGTEVRALSGHHLPVTAIALTPDGRRLVSASVDRTLAVWDVGTGARLRVLEGHAGSIYALALTPDGRQIVSGGFDHRVMVWDLESGSVVHTLTGHTGSVNAVLVTPNLRVLSAGDDCTVRVWDPGMGSAVAVLEGHDRAVRDLAITPDGTQVLATSDSGVLIVWELATRRLVRRMTSHTDTINALALASGANGTIVATGADDDVLRVWDIVTGSSVAAFGADSPICACAFTPDGQTIIAGEASGQVHFLRLEAA